MSVGLLLFPNSKGVDIDIHEDCFGAFSYTKVMMCNEKVEVGKCWICHNSVQMYGNGWVGFDPLPDSKESSGVDVHSDCLAALNNTMEVMQNTRGKKPYQ
jgi:hypothetical protein